LISFQLDTADIPTNVTLFNTSAKTMLDTINAFVNLLRCVEEACEENTRRHQLPSLRQQGLRPIPELWGLKDVYYITHEVISSINTRRPLSYDLDSYPNASHDHIGLIVQNEPSSPPRLFCDYGQHDVALFYHYEESQSAGGLTAVPFIEDSLIKGAQLQRSPHYASEVSTCPYGLLSLYEHPCARHNFLDCGEFYRTRIKWRPTAQHYDSVLLMTNVVETLAAHALGWRAIALPSVKSSCDSHTAFEDAKQMISPAIPYLQQMSEVRVLTHDCPESLLLPLHLYLEDNGCTVKCDTLHNILGQKSLSKSLAEEAWKRFEITTIDIPELEPSPLARLRMRL
jgi:hypothetical protein